MTRPYNTSLTASERTARARLAAHTRWSKTDSREASEAARKRINDRFERQVDPDGTLDSAERARRAEHARKTYFTGLAMKSVKARRRRKQETTFMDGIMTVAQVRAIEDA